MLDTDVVHIAIIFVTIVDGIIFINCCDILVAIVDPCGY